MAFALKQPELGTKVEEVCRKQQRSDVLQLEEEVRGVGLSELRRMRQLEEENAKLILHALDRHNPMVAISHCDLWSRTAQSFRVLQRLSQHMLIIRIARH